MFIVAPLGTDAAIDHKPWATGALIVANVAMAVFLGYPEWTIHDPYWGPPPEPPFVNSLVLQWGSLNPIQWVTHAFVHGGFIHLFFNMIFLWTFGLIVEGAVGWQRFLAVYGLAAVIPGAAAQILMLGADGGGAVGASAAISGLMAISALWAPKNHLDVLVWILVIIRKPEVSVLGFCALWLGLDVFFLLFHGFVMSSALAHVAGAAVGLRIGVVMLRRKWVDCEGWDYLSLRAKGKPRSAMAPPPADSDVDRLARFRTALEAEDGVGAEALARQLSQWRNDWTPTKSELSKLIQLLRKTDRERCLERMHEYITRVPDGSASVQIMAADLLLDLDRPTAARQQLESLVEYDLTDAQRRARDSILERADDRSGGGLELE